MSKLKTVNFKMQPETLIQFDRDWEKLGYRNRTEVFHEKVREIREKAKEA